MKKLLFISLFFSVPVWGMEVGGPEHNPDSKPHLVDSLYLKIDPEKETAFYLLQKIGCPTNWNSTGNYKKGLEAQKALDAFVEQQLPQPSTHDKSYYNLNPTAERPPEEMVGKWQKFGIFLLPYRKKQIFRIKFDKETLTPILSDLPYVERVVSQKEYLTILALDLLQVLNKDKTE